MVRILFSTTDSHENAIELARRLIEEKLAACVSIIPNITSVYKWKGTIEQSSEFLLLIKTSEDRIDTLIQRISELHPYELPEAVSFRIDKGLPSYLEWVQAQTRLDE